MLSEPVLGSVVVDVDVKSRDEPVPEVPSMLVLVLSPAVLSVLVPALVLEAVVPPAPSSVHPCRNVRAWSAATAARVGNAQQRRSNE